MSEGRRAESPVFGPRLGWLAGALLFVGLLLVVTHSAEERELARLLREAQPAWLLVAAGLQGATYVCAAAVWQRALARRGVAVPLGRLVPLGLAKLFMDQAVPSAGMSGTVLVVRALERRGIARNQAVGEGRRLRGGASRARIRRRPAFVRAHR